MYNFEGNLGSDFEFDVVVYGYKARTTEALTLLMGKTDNRDIDVSYTGYDSVDDMMVQQKEVEKLFDKFTDGDGTNKYKFDLSQNILYLEGYFNDVKNLADTLYDMGLVL